MTRLDEELEIHRAELTRCRRCAYANDVQPIVSMARSPRVMLVGQAPGKTESAGGKPFAGRAGRTLFSWLAGAGIDEATARSCIYIAAITRCYPGPSPSGRGDRVPALPEREHCATWLERELQIIRPALIIPVGRLAIDVFLGPRPLNQAVGREFSADDDVRRPVPRIIPLPHPSGASSWIHAPGHGALLRVALELIAARWAELKPRSRAA